MDCTEFKNRAEQVEKLLSKQPFFVIGCEKSGTTWLQKMLDAHPKIACIGEGHLIHQLAAPPADNHK